MRAHLKVAATAAMAILALLAALLGAFGCGDDSQRYGTAAQAMEAFETLYPGFEATRAQQVGTRWQVDGVYDAYADGSWLLPVRVPVTRGEHGGTDAVVEGDAWSGSADLAALLLSRSGSRVLGTLASYLEDPSSVVTNARRAAKNTVVVRVSTADGTRPPLSISWNSREKEWEGSVGFRPATWLHQAQQLAAAVGSLVVAEGSSPPEPRVTTKPRYGRFTAQILAVDAGRRTVTVDRVQLFVMDGAFAAAAEDGEPEPPSGIYIRNRVRERTELPLSPDAVITRFFPDVWDPGAATGISAMDTAQFFRRYRDDEFLRRLLRSAGAWVVVSDGKVTAIVGNYAP